MRRRQLAIVLLGVFLIPIGLFARGIAQAGDPAGINAPPAACAPLTLGLAETADASPVLTACAAASPSGAVIDLAPVIFYLRSPLTIDRPVTIRSKGVAEADPTCAASGDARCASIILATPPMAGRLPIDIRASRVVLSHLIIRGRINAPDRIATCRNKSLRPSGGGVRVQGSDFRLIGSVLRDMGCYTALEATRTAKRSLFERNQFGPNGSHEATTAWSDGLTIHDNASAVVSGNRFVDNTDVQLILGGCTNCLIANNDFSHSNNKASAAFADLMLHVWPTTSGNFTGTRVAGNRINCGAAHGCGYGIQIGPSPWKPAGTVFGATVSGNSVANAMVGINVDGVSGSIRLDGNRVARSGGSYPACGGKSWTAINISPQARPFVSGSNVAMAGTQDSAHCLLNFPPA